MQLVGNFSTKSNRYGETFDESRFNVFSEYMNHRLFACRLNENNVLCPHYVCRAFSRGSFLIIVDSIDSGFIVRLLCVNDNGVTCC